MRRKKQIKRQPKMGRLMAIFLVIAAVIVTGIVVWQRSQPAQPATSGTGITLPDSDTAFTVPTQVGQPAPEFTAIGVDGQPYTVTPGDGRPKVIVFYMGFQ
jgi:hypothetical protein